MYYVYTYLDPTKPGHYQYDNVSFLYEPFYIGKGTGNRDKSHPTLLKSVKTKTPFYGKLSKLQHLSVKPYILRLIDNISDESEAFSIEHDYIKMIGTRFDSYYKGPLMNMNLGGTGGICPSKELRDKISRNRKGKCCGTKNVNYGKTWMKGEGNPYYGKHHSDKVKKKMKRKYLILENGEFTIINDVSEFMKRYNYTDKLIAAANHKHKYKNLKIIKIQKNDNDIEKYKKILLQTK